MTAGNLERRGNAVFAFEFTRTARGGVPGLPDLADAGQRGIDQHIDPPGPAGFVSLQYTNQ